MDIKELKERKRILESELGDILSRKISEFASETEVPVDSVSVSVNKTFGTPDITVIVEANLNI